MAPVTRNRRLAARSHVSGRASEAVTTLIDELRAGLAGAPAAAVLYFASSAYDPIDLAGPLSEAFDSASVIGCSTAGEFSDRGMGTHGISAIALPEGTVLRTAAGLGELDCDPGAGAVDAVRRVEAMLRRPLRDLDPRRYLALTLIDGVHAAEERVTARLRDAAPQLDLIGGSAADDSAFSATWVAVGEDVSWNGVALLVMEVAVPFRTVTTCSFESTGLELHITKADPATRTVLEFDGRPAAIAYADAVGGDLCDLTASLFMSHPVGLVRDGEPWIRSPRSVKRQGMTFYAEIEAGTVVEIMRPTDLVDDTRRAIGAAIDALGGRASGAILFNCILRKLEIDAMRIAEEFVETFAGVPTAGFHTYGETTGVHVNQTLTGVVFG